MTPLDLTQTPPRSPRQEIGGLCMLPRMIDVARAKLPGGKIGTYQIGRGMSRLVLAHLEITADEFVDVVAKAANEDEVVAKFADKRTPADNRMLNVRLRRITVADVPDDLRKSFERFYGADLPANKRVFDVLEEDDARAFGAK